MSASTLPELEALIDRLSPADQLRLLEDLAHRLRARVAADEQTDAAPLDSELAVMARDRDIRAELQAIDREFTATLTPNASLTNPRAG
ncbi:MAG TPA: hypothetical protein VMH22_03925 [bacterium]|nr:hypothetical protein [bacterium]